MAGGTYKKTPIFNLLLFAVIAWALLSAVSSKTPGSSTVRNDPGKDDVRICQQQTGTSNLGLLAPHGAYEKCLERREAQRGLDRSK